MDFSIPYLMRDENYPIGGWAIELAVWLRALENAGHDTAVLTWKGALEHVGSGQQIKLIETYDPARGIRVAKYFYSLFRKYWRLPAAIARMFWCKAYVGYILP